MKNMFKRTRINSSKKFEKVVIEMLFLKTMLDSNDLTDDERERFTKEYQVLKTKFIKRFRKLNGDNLKVIKRKLTILNKTHRIKNLFKPNEKR